MAAFPRASLGLVAIMLLALDVVLPNVQAQAPAPAPTSDGASIDQGIAYLLMLLALVLTYLVHPLNDASTPCKLF
ncbi:Arabinogalactan peptide [Musa troglodytarum]|uniref:Arabinogalactan peptide n=1 Tax=Musa troglodytarum TaxID=320322 RepID=A0A9E7K182_9LILI|nr:Arabinogalactan peptide [Musa troglodytarum]